MGWITGAEREKAFMKWYNFTTFFYCSTIILTVYDFLMLAYEKNILSTQNSHSARTIDIIQCNQQKPKFVFKMCTHQLD